MPDRTFHAVRPTRTETVTAYLARAATSNDLTPDQIQTMTDETWARFMAACRLDETNVTRTWLADQVRWATAERIG